MRPGNAGRTLPVLIAATVLLVGMWFGVFQSTTARLPMPQPSPARADDQIGRELGTFARLAKTLKPDVVNIAVEKVMAQSEGAPEELLRHFFGNGPQPDQPHTRGQGSGVIISPDGYIVTNNHVVSSATEVRVTTSEGEEYSATVVGTDPKTDLALVKVRTDKPMTAAPLGDSDRLEVGDWVMAIGNPFGLEATVTVGVLSGKGRVIGAGPYDDYLQTDASINPGNSGGPLFNTQGEVVGINTAILPNGQGIGFSIPVNLVKDIVAQLKTSGHVTRGFVGLGIQPLTPKLKEALSLPANLKGALVSNVVAGGPAAQAGAHIQDVVTSINGRPVVSDRDLLAQVARLPIDSSADLSILREGAATHLSIKVARRPDEQQAASEPVHQPVHANAPLGFQVQDLTPQIAQELETSNPSGVVITGVARGSAAARAGLQAGDIIRKVGNHAVKNSSDFTRAVDQDKTRQNLALLVERQGNTVFVVVED